MMMIFDSHQSDQGHDCDHYDVKKTTTTNSDMMIANQSCCFDQIFCLGLDKKLNNWRIIKFNVIV
jgi:hypothetical protein